jgi:hypothetical protein
VQNEISHLPKIKVDLVKLIIMRKIMFLPVLLLGVIVLSASCMKERGPGERSKRVPDEIVLVKIAPNQSYQMDITGDATVSIASQALNYLVSETRVHVEKGNPIYIYQPKAGFIGNDEVKLASVTKVSAGSSGYGGGCNGGNGDKTIVKNIVIKFTVSN